MSAKTLDRSNAGRRVFIAFATFFAVFITVDIIFVTLAVRTHRGVVTEQAYEKGLAQNAMRQAKEMQTALGWQGEVIADQNQITFTLQDHKGHPVAGAVAAARLSHTRKFGASHEIMLQPVGPGVYQAEMPTDLRAGVWQIRLWARAGGDDYQTTASVTIP